MFVAAISLGVAQVNANPPIAPQGSTTPTLTETATTTATATLANDPCAEPPPAPELTSPDTGVTIDKTTITLRWNPIECANKYRILVRRGSKDGPPVVRGKTKKRRFIAGPLSRGYWYYWNIKACRAGLGCERSETWRFRIPTGPTPVPQPTGQPTTPPQNGTPVPGNPPSNLVNYYTPDRGGTGVYLSDEPTYLYRFECSKDSGLWGHYLSGSTMYHIALWYYANEKISYTRLLFDLSEVVETGTLYANSQGYVEYNVNTASWTPDYHYHLIFTGQSSGVTYCGHYDVQSGAEPSHPPVSHTEADVERVYRAAGLEPPR
jgi:hypothetical protein